MTEHLHELPETDPKPMTATEALRWAMAGVWPVEGPGPTLRETQLVEAFLREKNLQVLPAIPMPRGK